MTQTLPRDFVSPLGNWGAIAGMLVFLFSCIAILTAIEGIW
jgi:hypothetical protein